jgi:hypothetical protein
MICPVEIAHDMSAESNCPMRLLLVTTNRARIFFNVNMKKTVPAEKEVAAGERSSHWRRGL